MLLILSPSAGLARESEIDSWTSYRKICDSSGGNECRFYSSLYVESVLHLKCRSETSSSECEKIQKKQEVIRNSLEKDSGKYFKVALCQDPSSASKSSVSIMIKKLLRKLTPRTGCPKGYVTEAEFDAYQESLRRAAMEEERRSAQQIEKSILVEPVYEIIEPVNPDSGTASSLAE
jgi:hypothetical protein